MSTKRLVSMLREIPEERLTNYQDLWSEMRELASQTGARAWRFQSENGSPRFIEFIEFDAQRDPRGSPKFDEIAGRLDAISPAQAEEWRDATSADHQTPGK